MESCVCGCKQCVRHVLQPEGVRRVAEREPSGFPCSERHNACAGWRIIRARVYAGKDGSNCLFGTPTRAPSLPLSSEQALRSQALPIGLQWPPSPPSSPEFVPDLEVLQPLATCSLSGTAHSWRSAPDRGLSTFPKP